MAASDDVSEPPARRRSGRTSKSAYRAHRRRVRRLAGAVDALYSGLDTREAHLMEGHLRWLSDNDYLIHRQVKQIGRDLPASHFSRLGDSLSGSKHVGDLVEQYLTEREGVYQPAELERFLEPRQRERPLELAELWALPTLLRLGALERLVAAAVEGGEASEVAVGQCVTSLHAIEREDWSAFVARASLVERVLAEDPGGVYARTDSDTRSWYRREVETIARYCDAGEVEVAAAAVARARAAAVAVDAVSDQAAVDGVLTGRASVESASAHVGYHLVDSGREEFERALGCRPPVGTRLRRALRRNSGWFYAWTVAVLALAVLVPAEAFVLRNGAAWQALVTLACLVVPAWLFGEVLAQRLIVAVLPPSRLPKLDLEDGVPESARTLLVVPALLSDRREVARLFRQLERHYVGNEDPNLHYALLADLLDADEQHAPDDDQLLLAAAEDLAALRERQPSGRFYLLCRGRQFNPAEGTWMGWERKRGKLEELNRWLVEGDPGSLEMISGDLRELRGYAHVITLDADTRLPPTAARRLIGTLVHPLNTPRYAGGHRPERGFTVLQPRVQVLPAGGEGTLFERWFSGSDGVDLYTRAVSNPYMDLFGEGLYAGKGIYHLHGFARSLRGVVPENAILSHDLLEGGAGRCGLVSDVVVYEEYPSTFLAHARRQHRWMRGDWQLLPYLRESVPAAAGSMPNPLSWTARWAMGQNLVRSLQPLALVATLLAGWLLLPGGALRWTLLALLLSAAPWLVGWLGALRRPFALAVRELGGNAIKRWLVEIATLPFAASNGLDAALTSVRRVYLTREKLLQWRDAARVNREETEVGTKSNWWLAMPQGPLVALATLGLMAVWRPDALLVALPLLVTWVVAPEVARRISLTRVRPVRPLAPEDADAWRRMARRTWLYFERFVGPEDHWLPPDHFQESPRGAVAHRTSPTNIGLLLTSTFAAYDLGFTGARSALTRLANTFATLAQLERHRGHLYNWYDTQTLQALAPRYVSTVDSGNLLASLIALRESCLELPQHGVVRRSAVQGLVASLELYAGAAGRLGPDSVEFEAHARRLIDRARETYGDVRALATLFDELEEVELPGLDAAMLELVRRAGPQAHHEVIAELGVWSGRLHAQVSEVRRERDLFLPWLAPGAAWPEALLEGLPVHPQLGSLGDWYRILTDRWAVQRPMDGGAPNGLDGLRDQALESLASAAQARDQLLGRATTLAQEAETYLQEADLGFLYDERRRVFRIGYQVDEGRLDEHAYDLFASEARLASFVAVALAWVPPSHWSHLARPIAAVAGERVLLSWSGTMFEYLMPSLFLKTPPGSLTEAGVNTAIARQRAQGVVTGRPWGVSESAYALTDAQQNYQYRAFGVPDLALSHESNRERVTAPYASLMAARYVPQAALQNLARLRELGGEGLYGFYDALDFAPERAALGADFTVVRSYMVHHHGMAFMSIANLLTGDLYVKRFHRDVRVQSAEYLLDEGPVSGAPLERLDATRPLGSRIPQRDSAEDEAFEAWQVAARGIAPSVHSLSNGDLTTVLGGSGGGFTRWRNLDLTRWRSDPTLDTWGQWLYLQELDGGTLRFVAGRREPESVPVVDEHASFGAHQVEFRRDWGDVSVGVAVAVAADVDAELRSVTVANHTNERRGLALCTFGEVVLTEHGADLRHPAFGALFVESEVLHGGSALLFRRRPRAAGEAAVYLGHRLVPEVGPDVDFEHETDRARFLGRYSGPDAPRALLGAGLSGTTGATLDPAFALRAAFHLEPYSTRRFGVVTAAGETRRAVLDALERFGHFDRYEAAFESARQRAVRELKRARLDGRSLPKVQAVLSSLLYPAERWRPGGALLSAAQGEQSQLWAHGISGDLPLLVVRVAGSNDVDAAVMMLGAHRLWREQRLAVELVLLNLADTGYQQDTLLALRLALSATGAEPWLDRRGGVFVIAGSRLSEQEVASLTAVATAVIDSDSISAVSSTGGSEHLPAFFAVDTARSDASEAEPLARPSGLSFDNGHGGFEPGSGDYVMWIDDEPPPAPWVNVLANAEFGSIVTESGASTTWAVNSGENRLTPWSNDAVSDPSGEALYLRDEETGAVWSPTPLPAPGGAPYIVRHGPGRTRFEHVSHGLRQALDVCVADDAAVKIARLTLTDLSGRPRRATATYYLEWVLGNNLETTGQHVVPEFDGGRRALLASNPFHTAFGAQVAFLASSDKVHGLTTDRREFLGSGGSRSVPAALGRIGLSGRVDPRCDQCAALQVHVDLPAGGEHELWFVIGRGADRSEAERLIEEWSSPGRARQALAGAQSAWRQRLGQVVVRTPDPAADLMLNGWLLYQAWACRLWGRSGFYQSSGAFGFRDQLQDALALMHAEPALVRRQILEAAGHQFEEGDVLHWWHPPSGQGVRTRISDDLAWLPYVTAAYVAATGDASLLEETVPYLRGPELAAGEHDRYDAFTHGPVRESVHRHCLRALERACTSGSHGLPLIGGGDWNDGFDRVGGGGKGESVWLAWFLIATLRSYANVCASLGEDAEAERWLAAAEGYRRAVEEHAWDGDWYLRAFYDDGSPLGSHANAEAKIDAIAQAWSVLSGVGDTARSRTALEAVDDHLVDEEARVLALLTPPFDDGREEPGYIKGYLPGVRENGGQYTHGAIWVAWAHAALGEGDRAFELFELLNPIDHARDRESAQRYRNEPYVVSADVYSVEPHRGRGGWSWYTGSAAWLYRLGLEAILGVRLVAGRLWFEPCIPAAWPGYEVDYRHGDAVYRVKVDNAAGVSTGVASLRLDGSPVRGGIELVDDGSEHVIEVVMGPVESSTVDPKPGTLSG